MELIITNDKLKLRRERQREYYNKNKDVILSQKKQFYIENKIDIINKTLARREAKPEEHKEQFKKRYEKNKDKFIEASKATYLKHRETILLKRKETNQKKKQAKLEQEKQTE